MVRKALFFYSTPFDIYARNGNMRDKRSERCGGRDGVRYAGLHAGTEKYWIGIPKVSRRVKFTPAPETCNFEWILYDRISHYICGIYRVIIRCISDYVNYSIIKSEKVARWERNL